MLQPLGQPPLDPAIRAYDLLQETFPPNRSFIEPFLLTKGGTLLLGGEAKAGKSFIMLEAARALTTGTPFMGCAEMFPVPEPVRVLYIEQENGKEANQERIRNMFAKDDKNVWMDNFLIKCKDLTLHFNDNTGMGRIKKLCDIHTPNVIILDPISYLYHKDENSNTDVGKLFYMIAQLKEIGKEYNLSFIFAHHFGKPPWGKNATEFDFLSEYNFRGASKWKDGGDTIITIRRFKDEFKPYRHWKLRMRFLTRHGSSPPECISSVAPAGRDRVVRWERWASARELKKEHFDTPKDNTAVNVNKIELETREGKVQRTMFNTPDADLPIKL